LNKVFYTAVVSVQSVPSKTTVGRTNQIGALQTIVACDQWRTQKISEGGTSFVTIA